MQRKVHKAQDSVEGPVLVLVVMCSWQWTQVKVTGPSESSVGTTSWVATGPGARCSGPTTEKMAKIHETHKIRKYKKQFWCLKMAKTLKFCTQNRHKWLKVQS